MPPRSGPRARSSCRCRRPPRPPAWHRARCGCGRGPPDRRAARSLEAPQTGQLGEPLARLAPRALLLVGTTHRTVVAPLTGAFGGRGGKKARRQRAVDHGDDGATKTARVIVERHDPLLVATVGGAVVEAAG